MRRLLLLSAVWGTLHCCLASRCLYKFSQDSGSARRGGAGGSGPQYRLVPWKNELFARTKEYVQEEAVVEALSGDETVLWSVAGRVLENINPRLCRLVLQLDQSLDRFTLLNDFSNRNALGTNGLPQLRCMRPPEGQRTAKNPSELVAGRAVTEFGAFSRRGLVIDASSQAALSGLNGAVCGSLAGMAPQSADGGYQWYELAGSTKKGVKQTLMCQSGEESHLFKYTMVPLLEIDCTGRPIGLPSHLVLSPEQKQAKVKQAGVLQSLRRNSGSLAGSSDEVGLLLSSWDDSAGGKRLRPKYLTFNTYLSQPLQPLPPLKASGAGGRGRPKR